MLIGILGKIFVPALTSVVVETVVGRVVPEVVNVGRRIAAKEQGTPFVPMQDEVTTAKGARTTVFALLFVAAKLAEWSGYWAPPSEVFNVLASLMTGSLALKAIR